MARPKKNDVKKGKGSSRRDKLRSGVEKNQERSYKTKDSSGRFKSIFKNLDGKSLWKCGEGDHVIDIIPFITGENNPNDAPDEGAYVLDLWVHYGVGVNDDSYVCMNLTGGWHKPCPICEHVSKLAKRGASDEELRKFKAKRRAIYNIVCYDSSQEEDKGIQIWDSPHYMTERQILEIAKIARTGKRIHFADPDRGKSIAFAKKGKGVHTRYEGMRLQDRDEPIPDDILESAYTLDELIHLPSYEEVAVAFYGDTASDEETGSSSDETCPFGHEIGEDFDQTDDCDDCEFYDDCGALADSDKKPKKKVGKKKVKEVDPEEEDEEDDEEEEEEEEEEEVKPKKGRGKKKIEPEEEDEEDDEEEEEEEEEVKPKRGRGKKIEPEEEDDDEEEEEEEEEEEVKPKKGKGRGRK
jgi:hypothetical protein